MTITELEKIKMGYCGNCGEKIEKGANFCGKCGAVVEKEQSEHVYDVIAPKNNSARVWKIIIPKNTYGYSVDINITRSMLYK